MASRNSTNIWQRWSWLKILLAVAMTIPLNSCMRLRMNTTIEDNGEISLYLDIGIDKTFAGSVTSVDICRSMETSRIGFSEGREYEDDDYIGCRIWADMSVDQLNGESQIITRENNIWTFHLTADDLQSAENTGVTLSESTMSEFSVSVVFPGRVYSYNKSGRILEYTVIWDDAADLFSDGGLLATGEASEQVMDVIRPLLFTGGGAVLILIGTILIVKSRRRLRATGHGKAASGQSDSRDVPVTLVDTRSQHQTAKLSSDPTKVYEQHQTVVLSEENLATPRHQDRGYASTGHDAPSHDSHLHDQPDDDDFWKPQAPKNAD